MCELRFNNSVATEGKGLEGDSLLCGESLCCSSPSADDVQLPAQASSSLHLHALSDQTWTSANDLQFALIVPKTFLASNQHLLAGANLVSSGEDIGGAAGAVVAVQASIRQDDNSGHKIISTPTLLREVVSLTSSSFNGFDTGHKVVSSSAILLPTLNSGHRTQHLASLAEVALQQAHIVTASPSPLQQQQSPTSSPAAEVMHSGQPETGPGHSQGHVPTSSSTSRSSQEQHPHSRTMLSAGASAGLGVFTGSLTHGEPVSRVLGIGSNSSQYSGSSSSTSTSMAQYSSLYNVHGQPSLLTSRAPYPTSFFSQYPATTHYSPASLVASTRFPHIESYSAVLASMGSHVQHGGHTSPQIQTGSRTAYLPATMGQYSHRSLSSSSSPGPSSHSPSVPTTSFSVHDREVLMQSQECERDPSTPPSHHGSGMAADSPSDDKGLLHSSGLHYPHRGSPAGLSKDVKGDLRDPLHKVPSGKEGSLKHRILTRPPDIPIESTYGHTKDRSQSAKGEEESCRKRSRYMTQQMGFSIPTTDSHVFLAPQALGPSPPSLAHYTPHHTITTSITTSASSPSPTATTSSALHPARITEPSSSSGGSSLPPHLHYPLHFTKGSIIQLANGDLKRVEDLQTEDFVSSAQVSADLKVDSSTVVRIEEHPEVGTATLGFSVGEHRVQVTVEATLEHPFFVFGQGWSSCSTERTLKRYGLDCHKLTVGDVCISLTHKDVSLKAAEIVSQQQQQQQQQLPASAIRASGDSNKDLYLEGSDCKRSLGQKVPSGGQVEGNGLSASEVQHGAGASSPLDPADSQQSASANNRPPRKRRWSAPESDVEKEKMELEKQQSDSSQKE